MLILQPGTLELPIEAVWVGAMDWVDAPGPMVAWLSSDGIRGVGEMVVEGEMGRRSGMTRSRTLRTAAGLSGVALRSGYEKTNAVTERANSGRWKLVVERLFHLNKAGLTQPDRTGAIPSPPSSCHTRTLLRMEPDIIKEEMSTGFDRPEKEQHKNRTTSSVHRRPPSHVEVLRLPLRTRRPAKGRTCLPPRVAGSAGTCPSRARGCWSTPGGTTVADCGSWSE